MDITVSGKHVEVTDPIREYAQDKVAKMPRYFDRVQNIEVLLDKADARHYEIEMIAHVDRHDPFVATTRDPDLYKCIDAACDKMERQLTDHKKKSRNHKHATNKP